MSDAVNTQEKFIRTLLNLWLDKVFGPLYYMSFSFKTFLISSSSPEELLLRSPRSFYDVIAKMYGSELIAEAFICTLLTYAKGLGMDDTPKCSDFITWFKNNDIDKTISFFYRLGDHHFVRKISS